MSELVLNRISGDADFEFGSQMPSFAFAHLVFFRVGRPQKPAQFINKPLAPFPGATSNRSILIPLKSIPQSGKGRGESDGGDIESLYPKPLSPYPQLKYHNV
jgi:hypothetical protein